MRLAVGALAVLALVLERFLEAGGAPPRRSVRNAVAVGIGFASVAAWMQLFVPSYAPMIHRSEQLHYYVGSKYFSELGYTHLYECVVGAERELQGTAPKGVRDLRTNDMGAAPTPGPRCDGRFTEERWGAFREDVRFYRSVSEDDYWQVILADHGFNPPPTWAVLATPFHASTPMTLGRAQALGAVDGLLLAGGFALVGWAFGIRTMALCLVLWGTNAAATSWWIVGSMLRADFLFGLLAAASLLRKGRPGLAGAALGLAAAARVFPALLFVPMVAFFLGRPARRRTAGRFLMGGGLTVGALAIIACARWGSGSFGEFYGRLSVHDATPTWNRMGAKALWMAQAEVRADHSHVAPREILWKRARQERLTQYRGVFIAVATLALVVVWRTASRTPSAVVALVSGTLLLGVLVSPSCYYWSFLLLPALLSRWRRPLEIGAPIVAMLTNVAVLRIPDPVGRYAAMSLVGLAWFGFLVLLFSRRPRWLGG